MTPKKDTQASATRKPVGFTEEERAAMKQRVKEEKEAARRASLADRAAVEENEVLATIAGMEEHDRALAARIHEIVKASAPTLSPKLWYGMPAYASDGKIICFFQPAQKFKTRYATLGFNDSARLDEGSLWPVAFALKELTAAEEARISALVKKAVS